ncbi:phage portal protein [Paenibacillus thermotolerans]|uniref:phage portal protein n=1 Tax=Paenibacillus thermotolerans TaxID=3027807 RepID=UPI002368AAE6|nr:MULTISPECIES: phage portal protein [unclassified Paenibacillus]
MALMDWLRGFAGGRRDGSYTRMLNGTLPIYSQFGQNIYASDIVQECIDVIATEISKLQPRHIRTTDDRQDVPRGNLNRLFRFAPNQLMTVSEYLEKKTWLLMMNYNAFIIPIFDSDFSNGVERRTYRGFYPIDPARVEFLQDLAGEMLIRFHFAAGVDFTFRYADVIHIRKKFSLNEMMGGGANGQPDNAALLKSLQINHSIMQGLDRAVKINAAVQAVVKINTMLDDDAQRAERARFERLIASGETGILPVDIKGEFTPFDKSSLRFVDKETLAFLQSTILNWYGVPLPILTGEYDDNQYQAFYEKTLEPIVIRYGQAYSKTIFTEREADVGNEIVFYQRDMNYLSTNAKINLLKTAGEQGLLSDNQKLALLGYPPVPGGDRRTQSLNYIDVNLVNQYQLQMKPAKAVKEDEK